ncbi:hypothetical protein HDU93_001186, partial [Gonapodya sp. JEL0774]
MDWTAETKPRPPLMAIDTLAALDSVAPAHEVSSMNPGPNGAAGGRKGKIMNLPAHGLPSPVSPGGRIDFDLSFSTLMDETVSSTHQPRRNNGELLYPPDNCSHLSMLYMHLNLNGTVLRLFACDLETPVLMTLLLIDTDVPDDKSQTPITLPPEIVSHVLHNLDPMVSPDHTTLLTCLHVSRSWSTQAQIRLVSTPRLTKPAKLRLFLETIKDWERDIQGVTAGELPQSKSYFAGAPPAIRHLDLSHLRTLGDSAGSLFRKLVARRTVPSTLRTIHLPRRGRLPVPEEMLVNLCRRSTELLSLDLGGEHLSPAVSRAIHLGCPRLTCLAFSSRPVADLDLISLLAPETPFASHIPTLAPRLTTLNLGVHISLLPSTLLSMASLLPSLGHLAIHSNRTLASPGATTDLAHFLHLVGPRLVTLDVRASQSFMEDEVVASLVRHCKVIRRLDFGSLDPSVDPADPSAEDSAQVLAQGGPAHLSKDALLSLRALTSLTHLRLSRQPAFTDLTSSAVTCSMRGLEALDVAGCRITDAAVAA